MLYLDIFICLLKFRQAVTLHFQSYMNKIKIVLAVDDLTVPDRHQLLDDLAESLKLIKDAVVMKSSGGEDPSIAWYTSDTNAHK